MSDDLKDANDAYFRGDYKSELGKLTLFKH